MKTSSQIFAHARPKIGAASTASLPAIRSENDAIALLKQDHRKVEMLFAKFEGAHLDERKALIVQMICEELCVHTQLEEAEFYPAVRAVLKKDSDWLDKALVEHASLKWLIAQLEVMAPGDDLYHAKVTALKEYVAHHVKEEEGKLFPQVQKSPLDTAALGATMLETKSALQKELRH